IEGEDLSEGDEDYHRPISKAVSHQLRDLLEGKEKILVAGLGNREITPDALGPFVVDNLYITRHLLEEGIISNKKSVSAFVPGVMAQTGIETMELIKTVVREVKPDILLVIDALAARSANRLNTTIQISDTGIVPGSGVGNHRNAITKETMQIPVIAIGVPTVISVPAILYEAMETMMEFFGDLPIGKRMQDWSEEDKRQLSYEVCNERLAQMFVTPKNVDEAIKRMSYTISEAINAYIMEG
ncbi:MAG: GPR endopeptidase, partial [Lachnospiraceae bacterium]